MIFIICLFFYFCYKSFFWVVFYMNELFILGVLCLNCIVGLRINLMEGRYILNFVYKFKIICKINIKNKINSSWRSSRFIFVLLVIFVYKLLFKFRFLFRFYLC